MQPICTQQRRVAGRAARRPKPAVGLAGADVWSWLCCLGGPAVGRLVVRLRERESVGHRCEEARAVESELSGDWRVWVMKYCITILALATTLYGV
jgi:hypothetical protein